jgi:hypothetical protein
MLPHSSRPINVAREQISAGNRPRQASSMVAAELTQSTRRKRLRFIVAWRRARLNRSQAVTLTIHKHCRFNQSSA